MFEAMVVLLVLTALIGLRWFSAYRDHQPAASGGGLPRPAAVRRDGGAAVRLLVYAFYLRVC